MNDSQKKVISLIDKAEPKKSLKRWLNGYVPKNYKRLSISMSEAIELAKDGAATAMAYFGTKLYFTQSLLMGASLGGKYKKIIVVTPSQYGKSWLCGQISLLLANDEHQVYVAGATANTTEIIMGKVIDHIQNADEEIKGKLLESTDKIEKLQTAVSKRKIALKGGGMVESITLGDTFNNPLKGNNAIGRGGDFIIDEASLISDDAYAEMGRSEFASEDGEEFLRFEISNPHQPGRFFDKLTMQDVPEDTLIVWMDIRTAFEEGRVKSKEQVTESEFFNNPSTCKRYLLCELEDYSEDAMFPEPVIDDSKLSDDYEYFLGVDSAYKGKDGIEAFLTALSKEGNIRIIDHITIKKDNWIDGVTSVQIVEDLVNIIRHFHINKVCVDIGYGVYIVEGLSQRATNFTVNGINFGAGTTKFRKKAKHYTAVWGDNKRAEMHLDLQNLMQKGTVTFTSKSAKMLRKQMSATRLIRKPNNKIAVIPKDEIKRVIGKSPDELDAALLSIHALLLHTMTDSTLLYQN